MKRWGLFLIGAGAGVIVGVRSGQPAVIPAVAVAVVGLFLLVAGARSGGRDLVGDATEARSAPAPDENSFRHLGPRVEQILQLAEEQAQHVVADARATAAQIVAQARAEAERLESE